MIAGTIYGVILNDSEQLADMASSFLVPPYGAPPVTPVAYIKPRACVTVGDAPIPLPAGVDTVEIAATVGLLFSVDFARGDAGEAADAIGAACLAIDVCEPHQQFHRPAIRQRCRDGFLPLGPIVPLVLDSNITVTSRIDGHVAHQWSLDRLARRPFELAAELSQFMTLRAGDLLLVGLPGDPPSALCGARIEISAVGLPPLRTVIVPETMP